MPLLAHYTKKFSSLASFFLFISRDKLLKSPHSTHIESVVLIAVALVAIVEVLNPRVVATVLGRTPIVVATKTANNIFLQVQQI